MKPSKPFLLDASLAHPGQMAVVAPNGDLVAPVMPADVARYLTLAPEMELLLAELRNQVRSATPLTDRVDALFAEMAEHGVNDLAHRISCQDRPRPVTLHERHYEGDESGRGWYLWDNDLDGFDDSFGWVRTEGGGAPAIDKLAACVGPEGASVFIMKTLADGAEVVWSENAYVLLHGRPFGVPDVQPYASDLLFALQDGLREHRAAVAAELGSLVVMETSAKPRLLPLTHQHLVLEATLDAGAPDPSIAALGAAVARFSTLFRETDLAHLSARVGGDGVSLRLPGLALTLARADAFPERTEHLRFNLEVSGLRTALQLERFHHQLDQVAASLAADKVDGLLKTVGCGSDSQPYLPLLEIGDNWRFGDADYRDDLHPVTRSADVSADESAHEPG